ncbi:DUF1996 domain-containing protein, partial [Streptomyces sp. NPDC059627]
TPGPDGVAARAPPPPTPGGCCRGTATGLNMDTYPLCPSGSDVVRTFRFQSCWDGRNIDSANHRTHVAFEGPDGSCPAGFQAIPQLVQRIVYDVDAPSLQDGGRTVPLFAVDSFPEQLHKPVTDHGDFINVFDESLMRKMVDCINSGRKCGAGADEQPPSESAEPSAPGEPSETASPADPPAQTQSAEPSEPETTQPSSEPPADPPATNPPPPPQNAPPRASDDPGLPRLTATASPKKTSTTKSSGGGVISEPTERPDTEAPAATAAATPAGTAAAVPAGQESPGTGSGTEPQTEPQAVQGGLAETGAHLWPAVFGGLLLAFGAVLLWRARRNQF